MRSGLLALCLLFGCGSRAGPAPSDALLGGKRVRPADGAPLALLVGEGENAFRLDLLSVDGSQSKPLAATFVRTPHGLAARGAPRFGEPSLVDVEIADGRLSVRDTLGRHVGLRVPGVAAVVAEGKPVVATGDVAAPCILLRDGDAIVVENGLARLDGDAAMLTGSILRIGIEDATVALTAALTRKGQRAVRHEGRISPPARGVAVAAIGAWGEPLGAGISDSEGRFVVVASPGAARLFAVLGSGIGSAVVPSERGLPVSLLPLGHLRVSVRDEESGRGLPARLFVHGLGDTKEPNFGPVFRASGAGSLLDAEGGLVDTPLPEGRYRAMATHGPEWTVDAQEIVLSRGQHAHVELLLRHVVDTPGLAACDFHVHSGAGFDSDVTVEDRVRTLASVGIDFAVPSEHNRVGSYAAANELGLAGELSWVPAVEVTTYAPKGGHFNVFPYPPGEPPDHEHTSLKRLVAFVRQRAPGAIIQVNHPRLGDGMGYFDQQGLDRRTHVSTKPMEEGYDALEVYNGFDLPRRERAEALLAEWLALFEAGRPHWATGSSDSHTAQYLWAGFPRTYVAVAHDPDGAGGPPVSAQEVVSGLRAGHATVTSGPLIELRAGDDGAAGPGDELTVAGDSVRAHIRIRTAPWIDVRSMSVLVGGEEVVRRDFPETPSRVGREPGTPREAHHAAVRFDEVIRVPVSRTARTLAVVVRGERSLAETLPFLDAKPYAFTNPVRLKRLP